MRREQHGGEHLGGEVGGQLGIARLTHEVGQRDGQVPAIEDRERLGVAHGDRTEQLVVSRVGQIHVVNRHVSPLPTGAAV